MYRCYWILKNSHIPINQWRRVKFEGFIQQNVEINRKAKWWLKPIERNPAYRIQRPSKIWRMQWIYVSRQKYYGQYLLIVEHLKNGHWEIQSCKSIVWKLFTNSDWNGETTWKERKFQLSKNL